MSDSAFLDCSKFIDPVSEDYPVFLLEISHEKYGPEPLRVCSSNVIKLRDDENGQPIYGCIHNGKEYIYVPMSLSLPSQSADGAPTCSMTLFRTEDLVKLHRSITSKPKVKMYQVWASDTDTVAGSYPGFYILGFQLSQATISDTIGTNLDDSEPFPGRRFSNDIFGGIHR